MHTFFSGLLSSLTQLFGIFAFAYVTKPKKTCENLNYSIVTVGSFFKYPRDTKNASASITVFL